MKVRGRERKKERRKREGKRENGVLEAKMGITETEYFGNSILRPFLKFSYITSTILSLLLSLLVLFWDVENN